MIQLDASQAQQIHAENLRLQEELQMRDQLVQQLSQELFRLVKGNAIAPVPSSDEPSERHLAEVQSLREQLHTVEQQVTFYQEQMTQRDQEIYELRQTTQELTERSKMLEQVVQELPKVYRQKFAERMQPVREKVAMIQRENRQLHAELQSVNYRLAVKNRRNGHLDLPTFPRGEGDISLPTFGNA
ncbi:Npun_F5560 family protein [Leptolyngbya sp. NIES-2104]|uniref:Npun_F5560 family protein n=1 Tax=Leptolyngbya sp. NIES-2104 TaxID=1552121 RepID=UPI0006EC7D5A|nr:hypothetical protein NIES2104_57400 [Leptolyngbya sp. NIES-2104]